MTIISHDTTFLSRFLTKKTNLIVFFGKSFVSLFIPVLRDVKTKRSRAFDARLCFTPTCPDDGTSILDCTSPGSFFPVKNNNLLFLGQKEVQV